MDFGKTMIIFKVCVDTSKAEIMKQRVWHIALRVYVWLADGRELRLQVAEFLIQLANQLKAHPFRLSQT
jgi:hypothetical protein